MRSVTYFPTFLISLALVGCPGPETGKDDSAGNTDSFIDTYVPPVDNDGDGQSSDDGDCDDADPERYTGRLEDCDGEDNNCNGLVDEGYGDSDSDTVADCLDSETCDGLDNNGDGVVDEGFPDGNGDGIADCVGTESCNGMDDDGDGVVDNGFDADGDGYTQCGSETMPMDCNDSDASVNPGASEADDDGVDNNCDGVVDIQTLEAGDLSITEVMTNPQSIIDPAGEWIEIYNNTDHDITLNGLLFHGTDGDSHQVVSSSLLVVEPGGFFVFGSNADMDTNGGASVDYQWAGITLANEVDDIYMDIEGVTIDSLSWDDGFTMPDPAGASIMVDPGYYSADANDDTAVWCAATQPWGAETGDRGSPNTVNELCSTWDHDGDGFSGDMGDCDDYNDTVYPGAYEGNPALDNDCDGDIEEAPFSVPTLITVAEACSDFQLSGTDSYDNQDSALTYTWELVSAPSGSDRTSADLSSTTAAQPTFNPDVPGDYVFTLTVNDGGTDSLPTTLTVTVDERSFNTAPVADAGGDQTVTGTGDCQAISYGVSYDCDDCAATNADLSATGSSDPNSDRLEYTWELVTGSTSYASISDSEGDSTRVSFSAVPSTYAVDTDYEATIRLTAQDCMGATDTVDVVVTYTCTGA